MVLLQAGFNFADSIDYLVNIGVYDILLPFLLVFSIIFAILEKTQILGKDKTNINVVVSFVIGLLLVVQKGIVEIINLFLPRVSLIIVVILMGLLVISMVAGKEFKGLKGPVLGIAIILIIISLIVALTVPPSGSGAAWLSPADKEILIRLGIPLLMVLLVIGIVTAKPKKEKKKNILQEIAKGFGGDED